MRVPNNTRTVEGIMPLIYTRQRRTTPTAYYNYYGLHSTVLYIQMHGATLRFSGVDIRLCSCALECICATVVVIPNLCRLGGRLDTSMQSGLYGVEYRALHVCTKYVYIQTVRML